MSDLVFFVIGVFIGVIGATFTLDISQLQQVQNKCEMNKGTQEIKVSVDEYRVSCKDGAKFYISR